MYKVLPMRMKCDQILSVCLDITTHLCLHLAEGGSCDRGDIIHGETNQMVKGVFHIGLKLTNFSNYCSSTCLQLKLSNAISAMAAPISELNSMEKSKKMGKTSNSNKKVKKKTTITGLKRSKKNT